MSNETEVTPQSGTEEVSSVSNGAAGAAQPPRKGRGIDLSSLSPEELKQHKRAIDERSRTKRKEKAQQASFVFNSSTEPTKAEAKEILSARGLKNAHVLNLCYDLALVAAEQNNVPANRFLFQNGIRKMLESYQSKAAQSL